MKRWVETYYISFSAFFFISTTAIIVIPIAIVIPCIIFLTIHSPTITITIIIFVNTVIISAFIVTSLRIIFKNF